MTRAVKRFLTLCKKEPMLTVAALAAIAALCVTPPSAALLRGVDWRTLGTLFAMLTVLESFKQENIFQPLLRLAGRLRSMAGLSLFLVFSVFFSSMFVTNDVSLLVFVPLTILLFRSADKERYLLPILAMENIAAVRGSLLTPFGSPQNLFIFGQSGVTAAQFVRYMLPIWLLSGVLLVGFVLFLFRRNLREPAQTQNASFGAPLPADRRWRRIVYLALFALVLWMIVSRTALWVWVVACTAVVVLVCDRRLLLKTDYVLLLTFFCFFIFSASIASNEMIAEWLQKIVVGREYLCSILVSQVISNVPAAIVLYPFAVNRGALLYGLDSAGLCTLIGSLASVINYRLYVRVYPQRGGAFIRVFTLVSLAFFAFVAVPGYLLSRTPL